MDPKKASARDGGVHASPRLPARSAAYRNLRGPLPCADPAEAGKRLQPGQGTQAPEGTADLGPDPCSHFAAGLFLAALNFIAERLSQRTSLTPWSSTEGSAVSRASLSAALRLFTSASPASSHSGKTAVA